jgi:hypothetical protein
MSAGETTQLPKPDRDEAERFLNALDPTAMAFTFQTFDDNADRKDRALAQILHGALDRHWGALCRLNAAGAGIFVTINETDGGGRSAANIMRVRALFVDLDGAPLPERFHAEPHIVVESSPDRYHVYWRVQDCPLEQFGALQRRLAASYGGDPKVHDLPRVLRLPGFIHHKVKKGERSPPFRSRLVDAREHAGYTAEAAGAGLEEGRKEERAQGNSQDHAPATGAVPWTQAEEGRLRLALAAIPVDEQALKDKLGDSHLAWVNIGRAINRLGWGEQGFEIWRAWSAQSPEYNLNGLAAQWRSFERHRDDERPEGETVRLTTIYYYARQFGWQDEGPDTTIDPTYPATHCSPIEEARRELDQYLASYIRLASRTDLNQWEEYALNWGVTPVQAIRASTGIGKTQRFAAVLARYQYERPWLYLVPTHRLGEDVVQHFKAHGVTARVYRGCDAADPTIPGNLDRPKREQVRMCLEPDKVALAHACGQRADTACCRNRQQQCASYDLCGYQRQLRGDTPNVWLAAHNMLFHPLRAFKDVSGVVIDETFYPQGIVGMTAHGNEGDHVFTIDDLVESTIEPRSLLVLKELVEALRDHPTGGLEHNRLFTKIFPQECTDAIKDEWRIVNSVTLSPNMTATQIEQAKEHVPTIRKARFRIGMWHALRDLLEAPRGTVSGRLAIKVNKKGMRVLRIRGVREIVEARKVPTLILDATLPDVAILRTWYPQVKVVADIEVAMPASVHVRQVTNAPVSQRKLWGTGKKEAAGRNRRAIRRYILQRWLETGRQSMVVICQKELETWLKEAGLPERIAVEHFNAISGLDQYKHVRSLILIGRTVPSPTAVEDLAGALTGIEPAKVASTGNWYDRVNRGIRLADGSAAGVECDQHPDPMAEAVRYQICEAELMQAFGRARAINRTPETPLQVDILADVVLPVTVDEVVRWKAPSPAVEMAAEGIVLSSPEHMAAAWPEVWATARTAKWTLKGLKAAGGGGGGEKDTFSILNLLIEKVSFSPFALLYRLDATKFSSAFFDPPAIPTPRSWLEARLGTLQDLLHVVRPGEVPPLRGAGGLRVDDEKVLVLKAWSTPVLVEEIDASAFAYEHPEALQVSRARPQVGDWRLDAGDAPPTLYLTPPQDCGEGSYSGARPCSAGYSGTSSRKVRARAGPVTKCAHVGLKGECE